MTGTELLEATFPPRRWAVRDLVPCGDVTILAGKLKEGKSYFALALARAVADGTPFLERFPVEQGGVLYLGLEDDGARMQTRLHRLMAGSSKPPERLEILTMDDEFPKAEEGGWQALRSWIEDIPELRLVVVDILECFDPVRGGYHAAGATLRKLGKLARFYNIAVIGVMHMYRGPAISRTTSDWTDKIQGGIGGPSAAGSIIGFIRPRESDEGVIRATGKDVPELALRFKWDAGLITIEDGAEIPPESELTDKQYRVVEVVNEHGWGRDAVTGEIEPVPLGIDAREVARILRAQTQNDSWSHANTRQLMHQMQEAKKLVRNPDGEHRGLYFTPYQAKLLVGKPASDEQTSFAEAKTAHGAEFVA